jgi:predicted small lipoprotein YifL
MRFIIFSILMGFILVGCGTKGSLYLPENQYRQPVETPAPAAAPEQPANENSPVEKP